jgi:hypothetical protein
MVYLRNFEKTFPGGLPVSGATITIYTAILTGAHGAPLTFTDHNGVSGASTTSNADGMWAATDLPDGVFYDVRIEYNSQFKWYMGRTMHQVEHLYDDKIPAANRNLVKNGGHNGWARWLRNGSVTIAGISTSDIEIADYWFAAVTGGGDSATGTRAAASGIASQYVSELVYTRVGGNFKYRYIYPTRDADGLRSKTLSITLAVWQSANARLRPYIQDSAGTTLGTVQTSTGTWTTITCTRTIDAAATSLEIGWITDTPAAGAYTIRTTMALCDYGATIPVFSITPFDAGLSVSDSDRFIGNETIDDTQVLTGNLGYLSEILNSYARRLKEIIGAGAGNWRSAVPSSLTSLLALVTTAQSTANTGVSNAATALAAATTAQITANTGVANAATAQTQANLGVTNAATAQAAANAAQTQANLGVTNAAAAQTTANTAVTNAATAQSTANSAASSASAANTNANTRVAKSGDTMTGVLSIAMSNAGAGALTLQNTAAGTNGIGAAILNAAGSGFDFIIEHVTATFGVAVAGVSATFTGTVQGSVVNGTTAVRVAGTSVLDRSTHTGSQLASTISNLATAILDRSNHTGTQLASTISDFTANVATSNAANGYFRRSTSTYTGTGGTRSITGLVFTPRYVTIVGSVGPLSELHIIGTATAALLHTAGASPATAVASIGAGQFNVPASMNNLGEVYQWIAFE